VTGGRGGGGGGGEGGMAQQPQGGGKRDYFDPQETSLSESDCLARDHLENSDMCVCLCVCICIYLCICVSMCVCMHVSMYVYMRHVLCTCPYVMYTRVR